MSFNLGRLFEDNSAKLVAAQAEERSIEHVQRDIYESHRHRIFSLAFHMTGNELEAEQLLTDTFVRAFQQEQEPDGGIVDRALVAGLRAHFRLTPAAPVAVSHESGMGSRNVRRTDLEEALQELPAFERLAFLMRDVEGYSPEAISGLLEVTPGEVMRTLFSARIRLRSILSSREEERAA